MRKDILKSGLAFINIAVKAIYEYILDVLAFLLSNTLAGIKYDY